MYSCSIRYIAQIKYIPVEVNDMHYMNSLFVYMKIRISLAIYMCAKSLVAGYTKTELWCQFMVHIMRLVESLCGPWLHTCNRSVNRMIAPVPDDQPSRIWVSRYIYHLNQPRTRKANKTNEAKPRAYSIKYMVCHRNISIQRHRYPWYHQEPFHRAMPP